MGRVRGLMGEELEELEVVELLEPVREGVMRR